MFSQLQSGPLTFCSPERKEKIYRYISDRFFFCASDSSFVKQGTLRSGSMALLPTESGRENEFSSLRESISVYLHHKSVVGSRQTATVISLWFAELNCDWSIHN